MCFNEICELSKVESILHAFILLDPLGCLDYPSTYYFGYKFMLQPLGMQQTYSNFFLLLTIQPSTIAKKLP